MLPKIDVPTYELTLPSNGKKVLFRPFLVKEEKMLLMAAQTKDPEEIIKSTKQVLNNCILSEDVDITKLPFFDVDYMFITLRAKSIGETVKVNFICLNPQEDGSKCQGKFAIDLDILNVGLDKNEEQTLNIQFNDDLIFTMKYPTYDTMKTLDKKSNALDIKIKTIMACTEKIFTKGQYYTSKDFTPEELQNFIEGLTQEQFQKLDDFISNFPSFYINGEGTCPECGKYHYVRYKDFINFFL